MFRFLTRLRGRIELARRERWLASLRHRGMFIGQDVYLPESTELDGRYAHLVHIDHSCSFGPGCLVLAHDEATRAFCGVTRIGRVVLHRSCHIGARSILLPGVEIGPCTVVAAGSVVSRSLPAEAVCAGNPARAVTSLGRYLETHRRRLREARLFDYARYDISALTPERRAELVRAVLEGDAYLLGGRSAELRGSGGTLRTPCIDFQPEPPEASPVANTSQGDTSL